MAHRELVIRGASEHNLKGVNLRIPRHTLTTITGVSGSGKSSLAFDTIYQEGQRRFMESLSAYARQFLGKMEKPRLEHIEGLSPTISIDQKTVNRNPRSTVGTVTEIYDHFRLLYARLGIPSCPDCNIPIAGQSGDQITEAILSTGAGRQGIILAPIVKDRKGEYRKELDELRMRGYVRVRIDGEIRRLEEVQGLDRYKNHSIEIIVDRIALEPEKKSRVAEAVEQALREGSGVAYALIDGEDDPRVYSENFACPNCGFSVPELEPRLFSFNSPHGACPRCNGLGHRVTLDPDLLIRHPDISLRKGAAPLLENWQRLSPLRRAFKTLEDHAKPKGFSLGDPWEDLSHEQQQFFLFGTGGEDQEVADTTSRSRSRKRKDEDFLSGGLSAAIERVFGGLGLARYRRETRCDKCGGARLKPASLAVRFRERTIGDLVSLSVDECDLFLASLKLSSRESKIGRQLFKEIRSRLSFLKNVGLSYLTLERRASTLSGGEAQRIRLATQLGANLRGVLYILDEPSIGLHPRDNRRLIQTLQALRDQGNTVFVVEHDLDTMYSSDHVVDIGPGAGQEGGWVVAEGDLPKIAKSRKSVTGSYLRQEKKIPIPDPRRTPGERRLKIVGAEEHNLKKVDVEIPLGLLVAVTGVSGSGKSTLVNDILKRALSFKLHRAKKAPGKHETIEGVGLVDKVIEIDQSPIGRTPRSNPATYTKVFDEIRKLFCQVPEARIRGYTPGRFSFNVEGGRCDDCEGAGVKIVEMQFLPDVEVPCETCLGQRFNRETLDIVYKGKNVYEVLELAVRDACKFFEAHPRIKKTLDTMNEVGLGYVKLGQQATTLSGGEAQRVKLASELRRADTGNTLYILDEPTTGLHLHDVSKLVLALQELVEKGNTVLVIEHNLDVIKVVDYIVDLGPEGGEGGGRIVATGNPEEVAGNRESYTGKALRPVLRGNSIPDFAPKGKSAAKKKKVSRGKSASSDDGEQRDLTVKGATKNNLKNVDVRIPAGKLTVVTGVSGSGKTSLVFDTIFSEGQRRFVECLSTYARRFLGRLDQPPVDRIEGLAPAIAIDQRSSSHNPRSTVATSTEIYDYLRILFARIGIVHCHLCGERQVAATPSSAADDILKRDPGTSVLITAPLTLPESSRFFILEDGSKLKGLAPDLEQEGFARVRIDGELHRLDALKGKGMRVKKRASVHLVVDRIKVSERSRKRLVDSLEIAFAKGRGLAFSVVQEGGEEVERPYSKLPACPNCDEFRTEELTPRMFSFNSHLGACENCSGLGFTPALDEDLLFERPDLPVLDFGLGEAAQSIIGSQTLQGSLLKAACERAQANIAVPFGRLTKKARKIVLEGLETAELEVEWVSSSGVRRRRARWEGFRNLLLRWNREYPDATFMSRVRAVLKDDLCPACSGQRLRPELLAVTLGGLNIAETCAQSVDEGLAFFKGIDLNPREREVGEQAIQEVSARLHFLKKVGLEYLSLSRRTSTLSGGEAQRIRLATQIGSGLVGVIYVLDEPTIGLHQRDTKRLLETLVELRELGNTVLVVEHDEESIRFADHLIDIGIGAGKKGGRVVAEGTQSDVMKVEKSLTGQYLRGDLRLEVPAKRREGAGPWIQILGARQHNLQNIDVRFPRGALSAVTGVSGSGKSTLVMDILRKGAARKLRQGRGRPGDHDEIRGCEGISKLVVIDQSPIGRTPASNAATYTGVFDLIRDVFAAAPLAKAKGFKKGRFSFNSPLGRCSICSGRGFQLVDMQFLSDIWIECEACRGKRFNEETLRVEFKEKNIADVLEMEVKDALEFFERFPRIRRILVTLYDVGLGYLQLGQPAPTLSGGEAQRVKLSSELARPHRGDSLYILDEPTTGLHFADVRNLMDVLSRLVDAGNTVIVVEHNLDVIKACDWLVDLGPEGGDHGGELIAFGTPEVVAEHPTSYTGKFLKKVLPTKKKTTRKRRVARPAP